MSRPVALPDDIRVELERVLRRWRQLPLEHAERAAPAVRLLAQALADEAATRCERPRVPLPDLGPGTLVHQLEVCVYDAAVGRTADEAATSALAERLARLRRDIG